MQHARPCVHVRELFNLLGYRQKRGVGLFEVQRLPTARLLPIVAQTGFGVSVKKAASDKISWIAHRECEIAHIETLPVADGRPAE
jgi:hypothetical protein